jgi:hypothetical protein
MAFDCATYREGRLQIAIEIARSSKTVRLQNYFPMIASRLVAPARTDESAKFSMTLVPRGFRRKPSKHNNTQLFRVSLSI